MARHVGDPTPSLSTLVVRRLGWPPKRAKRTAHRAPARAYRVQGTEQRALPNSQSPREGEKGTELREVNRAPNVISHARCPWRLRRNKRTAK